MNLAIAAAADYLVTRDQDLLDLMTGHAAECKNFRQRFRNVKVVDPPGIPFGDSDCGLTCHLRLTLGASPDVRFRLRAYRLRFVTTAPSANLAATRS